MLDAQIEQIVCSKETLLKVINQLFVPGQSYHAITCSAFLCLMLITDKLEALLQNKDDPSPEEALFLAQFIDKVDSLDPEDATPGVRLVHQGEYIIVYKCSSIQDSTVSFNAALESEVWDALHQSHEQENMS